MTDGPYPNHLAELMRANGLTDPDLARYLGISKQQIFNLRWGHRKLTVEWAKRIAPHLGVSWQRLITGPPASVDQARIELLAAYDAMNEEQRRALLTMAKGVVRQPPPPGRPAPTRPFAGTGAAERRASEDCVTNVAVRRLPRVVDGDRR